MSSMMKSFGAEKMTMEVEIISREIIRPSNLRTSLHFPKPYKLSYLDQLVPTLYSPLIIFYDSKNHTHSKSNRSLSTQLKESLSETLNHFYPFSGRIKDNFSIDSFDEGVPFNEARVRCHMLDFLQHSEIESLNQFLPCLPFHKEPNPEEAAQLAIQVSIFDCGGIAIGMCASHKVADGSTLRPLFLHWAVATGGPRKKVPCLDFSEASSPSHFPPQHVLPQSLVSLVESICFNETKHMKTRRFVFDGSAVATLREKAKSERVDDPTRVEALTGFISEHAMAASRVISGSPKPTIINQAVNIRRLTKPRLPDNSAGNIFLETSVALDRHESAKIAGIQLSGLAASLREAVQKVNSDYISTLQGDHGFEVYCEIIQKRMTEKLGQKYPDVYTFSSWLGLDINGLDFGWGKPIWSGIMGEAGPTSRNLIFYKKTQCGNGVEAWVTLDEKLMAIFENDPEFLAFATLNPAWV
ncbi:hypothetical protein F2P56_005951 [Juglans regia]|uniref:Stemmadenine O-acetyltransferase-like n=2 Tax=Juglans regia TaxID=51240 RepID=A0A834CXS7_JUGRE|nr:hypothetical protein F2P56_005951 [Juglans regia]